MATLAKVVSAQGVVSALPAFQEDPRTSSKSRAVSVIRGGLTKWWESEDGKKWLSSRKKRFEDVESQ